MPIKPFTLESKNNLISKNELISREAQELISYRPHWIIRKGNLIFLLVTCLLFLFTSFVEYPELFKTSIRLFPGEPSSTFTVNSEMRLRKILIHNKQLVKRGQPLLVLTSANENFEKQSIIEAPTTGIIVLNSVLQEERGLKTGQELFEIRPIQNRYFGEIMVSSMELKKIKVGQKVLIRMEAYPRRELTYINGIVGHISDKTNDNGSSMVEVTLPTGLKTSDNKMILYNLSISYQAEIIISQHRLINKLISLLGNLTKR